MIDYIWSSNQLFFFFYFGSVSNTKNTKIFVYGIYCFSFLASPEGYECIHQACVTGYNIIKYDNYNKDQCAQACNNYGPDCKGFEFGTDHGGSQTTYSTGDCQLQSGNNIEDCDGADANLDFCLRCKFLFLFKIWFLGKTKKRKKN